MRNASDSVEFLGCMKRSVQRRSVGGGMRRFFFLLISSWSLFAAGCATPPPPAAVKRPDLDDQVLHPGDVIKVSFPGAQNLDATQPIRRDGKINLYMIGEVRAADKTPGQLEKELAQAYAPQLVTKDITVTVVSSSFVIYVSGAVMRPGKIQPDHAITALEAVMEAGGFDATRANMKAVVVIRTEEGRTKNFTLDLKAVLDGKQSEPFYLRSYDIVHVNDKFQLF